MGHATLVSPAPTIRRNGQHRDNGILFAVGPGVRPGQPVEGRLEDIAPTVLHLLGLPVPRDMDGRVLTEMLEQPGDVAYVEPSAFVAPEEVALSDAERLQVEERLKSLGYLE